MMGCGVENDAVKEISDFWAECGKNGTTEKIISYFPNKKIKGLLGISFSSELNGNKFPYGIGVEYDGREIKDADLEIVEIPAHTFAVFTCRGKMPEAFNQIYKKIVSEFFPQSTKYDTAGVLNWKFIRHRIFQTLTIPAKSGLR